MTVTLRFIPALQLVLMKKKEKLAYYTVTGARSRFQVD